MMVSAQLSGLGSRGVAPYGENLTIPTLSALAIPISTAYAQITSSRNLPVVSRAVNVDGRPQ